MADSKSVQSVAAGSSDVKERTKKAQATKAINAKKLEKLTLAGRYAYGELAGVRKQLDSIIEHILNGGTPTGELLAAVKVFEGEIGRCLLS